MIKNNYYITGDCHGDFNKIEFFCRNHSTSKNDCIIVLGDVGVNYGLDKTDMKIKELLSKLPITFLMVHGNHEERPFNISTYKEIEWKGGMVYYEEKYPTLLFAKDGEIYDFDGKKAIAIGGAYSIDKDYRLMAGLPWFPDEQPSLQIKEYVQEQLKKQEWAVDYVFSHTCPLFMEPTELFLKFTEQRKIDKSTEKWLEEIHHKLTYTKWYYGHFHDNRHYSDMDMLFEEIWELGKEDFIQKVGRPMYKENDRVMIYQKDSDNYLYGKVVKVYPYATLNQTREVAYDITLSEGTVYKGIVESLVEVIDYE